MGSQSHYIYYWDRILVALAILVTLLGVTGYGIYTWLQPEPASLAAADSNLNPDVGTMARQDAQRPSVEQTLSAETPKQPHAATAKTVDEKPMGPDATGSSPETRAAQEAAPNVTAHIEPHPPAETPARPAEAEQEATENNEPEASPEEPHRIASVTQRESGERPEEVEPASTTETEQSDPPVDDGPPAAPAPKRAVASPAQEAPETVSAGATFHLSGSALSSPAVKRFLLAESIANKEPVGDIHGIHFDSNGVATVYAFSEVAGLQNRTLYYHWIHNGRQVAKVRTRVIGKRWRSFSSKYINERMTGVWNVQLRDTRGRILAGAEFVY